MFSGIPTCSNCAVLIPAVGSHDRKDLVNLKLGTGLGECVIFYWLHGGPVRLVLGAVEIDI